MAMMAHEERNEMMTGVRLPGGIRIEFWNEPRVAPIGVLGLASKSGFCDISVV